MQFIRTQLFTILGVLLVIMLIARIMRERRHPGSTMAWLLAIILIPHLGIPFYLIFGGMHTKRKIGKKKELYPYHVGDKDEEKDRHELKGYKHNTERILVRRGIPPAEKGNELELLPDGQLVYKRLIEVLEKAEKAINLTTFILGRDEVGRGIVGLLAKKAEQGVKVRIILDSLGCLKTRGRFVDPIRKAGGEVGIFMPMLPIHKKWSAQLRNHRKIVIVDNCIALMGGMNFASEYMGPNNSNPKWHDFDVLIKGPLVSQISEIFNADWYFVTGTYPQYESTASNQDQERYKDDGAIGQVAASGPDVPQDLLSEAILTAILEAKKSVWVVTPYFIPDEVLMKSLALLSQWGRDIKIILPAKSNHLLADLARGSYLRTLREAGAEVLFFHSGMLHTKIVVIDRAMAVVGSANMDMRSLYLNYEIALFIYSSSYITSIEAIIKKNILPFTYPMEQGLRSLKMEMKEWVEDVSRVLSPFL